MQKYGLTATKELIKQSAEIAKDPIAIAVCRVMNNFRPIEDIIKSLLRDSDSGRTERYIACALAAHCYKVGLSYSLLSSAFDSIDLQKQFLDRDRLPISYSDSTKDYVIPTNPVLGQRVLRDIAEKNPDIMFEVYCTLGAYVEPYVNRKTIRSRTPEARLAQRLFDYDDVVLEFIPAKSENFYLRMKKYWEWNSRYWEQFALLKLDKFIRSSAADRFDLLSQSISHARHAIDIERHPLGLTTLGRILFEQMKQSREQSERSFKEAFEHLGEAIRMEGHSNRISIHPYTTLFNGVSHFLKEGGKLVITHRHFRRADRDEAPDFRAPLPGSPISESMCAWIALICSA